MTERGGKKNQNLKNATTWHAIQLVLTILIYFAYKYQLPQWENVKPKEKCPEMTGL